MYGLPAADSRGVPSRPWPKGASRPTRRDESLLQTCRPDSISSRPGIGDPSSGSHGSRCEDREQPEDARPIGLGQPSYSSREIALRLFPQLIGWRPNRTREAGLSRLGDDDSPVPAFLETTEPPDRPRLGGGTVWVADCECGNQRRAAIPPRNSNAEWLTIRPKTIALLRPGFVVIPRWVYCNALGPHAQSAVARCSSTGSLSHSLRMGRSITSRVPGFPGSAPARLSNFA